MITKQWENAHHTKSGYWENFWKNLQEKAERRKLAKLKAKYEKPEEPKQQKLLP